LPSSDLAAGTALTGARRTVAVLAAAARTGRADLAARYTWLSWSLGWLLRGGLEVAFYALLGVLLDSPEVTAGLVVGRAVFLGTVETMLAVQTTGWERQEGTLPLLVMAPGPVWPAFVGRATQWLPSACLTPFAVLLALGPVFGLEISAGDAACLAAITVVSAVSSFGWAVAVGAVALRHPGARNLVHGVATGALALVAGAFVPVGTWPAPVQAVAAVIPVSHTIEAARAVLSDTATWWSTAGLGVPLLVAAALGLLWLVVGCSLIERYARTGRTDGHIEIDE
jgi:ABC-2 type transport system permease protein